MGLSLAATLTRDQLGKGVVNSFQLGGAILAAIERQFGQGKVTFRLEGPTGNENNLFAWDSGFGADELGFHPLLQITVLGPSALPYGRAGLSSGGIDGRDPLRANTVNSERASGSGWNSNRCRGCERNPDALSPQLRHARYRDVRTARTIHICGGNAACSGYASRYTHTDSHQLGAAHYCFQ